VRPAQSLFPPFFKNLGIDAKQVNLSALTEKAVRVTKPFNKAV